MDAGIQNESVSSPCDATDDDDEDVMGECFIPSISDRLQVGYASMDRACQTNISEVVNLKKMASVLSIVVNDLSTLKRSLYFSKLTLQAEYDGRLEDVALELYSRVNKRIAEMEAIHKERIQVIRKSYKTQLNNALAKLSRDYHLFYGNKDAMAEAANQKKVEEMKKHQDMLRKNELNQKEMYEMLRLQVEETKAKDEELPSEKSSVVSVSVYTQEIEELKDSMGVMESRMDYLQDCLEETSIENQKLSVQVEEKVDQFRNEQRKVANLSNNIQEMKENAQKEREKTKQMLEEQKESLKKEMQQRIDGLRHSHQMEMDKCQEEARRGQNDLIRQQKLAEERRIKEMMSKKQEEEEEAKVVIEVPIQDNDFSRLQSIEKKQRAEIARLGRKIEHLTKLSEMKVRVLNEHIHSLKDEMFLRTTLQRQAAKVKQTTVTYVMKGGDVVPLGFQPCSEKLVRKLQLPNIVGAPCEENSTSSSQQETESM